MDRRTLIVSSLVTLGAASLAKAQPIGAPSSLPPASPSTAKAPPANAKLEAPQGEVHEAIVVPGRALGRRKPEKGFEPLAPALQERCSDQLSYSGVQADRSRRPARRRRGLGRVAES